MIDQKLERPRRVTFPGHRDILLTGLFQPGRQPVRGAVLVCHCFTCSKDYKVLSWLSRSLSELGHSVFRFDFSGLGESQGDFRETSLSTDVLDVVAAASWMADQGAAPAGLIGHSMGGAAAIQASIRLESVRSVVTMGTSYRVGWRIRQLLRHADMDVLEREGEAGIVINDRIYPVTREFMQDLERHSVLDTVSSWAKALLVVHGTADSIVPMADAERLFEEARQPKAFWGIPGGEHLLDGQKDRIVQLAGIVAGWIQLNTPAGDTGS